MVTWPSLLDKYRLRRPELVKRAKGLVQNSVVRIAHAAQRPEVHGYLALMSGARLASWRFEVPLAEVLGAI